MKKSDTDWKGRKKIDAWMTDEVTVSFYKNQKVKNEFNGKISQDMKAENGQDRGRNLDRVDHTLKSDQEGVSHVVKKKLIALKDAENHARRKENADGLVLAKGKKDTYKTLENIKTFISLIQRTHGPN